MAYSYRSSKVNNRRRNAFGQQPGQRRRSGAKRRPGQQYIDPARFIKVAHPVEPDSYEPQHLFADFDIPEIIKKNIAAKGYVQPSPIQDQTIPLGLAGHDVIGIANTGTGKTAAFGIPLLKQLIETDAHALVVAPTRELAQQIDAEFRSLAKGSGLLGAVLIGGASMGLQLRDLRAKPQIIIGTPGRIKDHLERGSLKLTNFNMVVLDEVDRMLDMGFVDDMRSILKELSPKRQSFFFSATMDRRVEDLIQTFAHDPETVALKTGQASDNVHQDVIGYAGTGEKLTKLQDLLVSPDITRVIIFDETQRSVERLSTELSARGLSATAIHGGKTQGQRQRALDSFKNGKVAILVATDVAARGIDVKDVSHVINYGLPNTYDDYVHRIGRAGRAGSVGYALTFVPYDSLS